MISHLHAVGEVAIFGGMPRDIARTGNDGFEGDVDLVVDATPEALDELLRSSHGRRNRFGGWRVVGDRHTFDVWTLKSTWAVSEGHVRAKTLGDLVDTTFFHSDAVVFLAKTQSVHSTAQHRDWLRSHIVDLNLAQNPNVAGAVSRILRIMFEWKEFLSPALAHYLIEKTDAVENLLSPRDRGRLSEARRDLVHSSRGSGLGTAPHPTRGR